MSLKYIKDYYNVPAKRLTKILFKGDICKITGSNGPLLIVRRLADDRKMYIHPTWKVNYEADS